MRQEWRALAANELAATQAELAVRQSAMPALAQRVDRTVLRAPLDGRVNRVFATTIGGSVAPGAPLVEIVPSEENLLALGDLYWQYGDIQRAVSAYFRVLSEVDPMQPVALARTGEAMLASGSPADAAALIERAAASAGGLEELEPGSLVAQARPPMRSIAFRTIARPIPVPGYSSDRFSR